MKRLTLLVLSLVLISSVSPAQINNLDNFIDKRVKKTTYLQLPVPDKKAAPDSLTSEQVLEDALILDYLFKNGYSGYYSWTKRGVNFDAIGNELKKAAEAGRKIPVSLMVNIIEKGLSGILDGHLSYGTTKFKSPYRHKNAYFADVLIEKQGGNFVVVKSDCDKVISGVKYTGPDSLLFPTLSPAGKRHFLFGTLSWSPLFKTEASFGGEKIVIPMHRSRISAAATQNGKIFSKTEVMGTPVLRLSTLMSGSNDSSLVSFSKEGTILKNTNRIILDITHNGGGNSKYIQDFFKNLNETEKMAMISASMVSPPVSQTWTWNTSTDIPAFDKFTQRAIKDLKRQKASPKIKWKVYNENSLGVKNIYKGTLYFLMNSGNASSAEMGIALAKRVKNRVLIGENSAGINTFGNVRSYQLKNSKININLPYCIYYFDGLADGIGFMPDLWLDSDNPVMETAKWIGNEENYCFNPVSDKLPNDISFEYPAKVNDIEKLTLGQWKIISSPFRGNVANRIYTDSSEKYSGNYSLCLDADSTTRGFYAVGTFLPLSFENISVSFSVKGENITPQQNPAKTCLVGFILTDRFMNKKTIIEKFTGSFDWQRKSLTADFSGGNYVSAIFVVMSTIPGKLWIDDISFRRGL